MEAKKGASKAMAYHDYVFVKSGKLLYLDLWSIVCVCVEAGGRRRMAKQVFNRLSFGITSLLERLD